MAAHVFNPSVPSVHPISGGMLSGRTLRVQGFVLPDADRFSINLQCGSSSVRSRDDIAFHFNPRFLERCVVRNTKRHQSWGHEERFGGLPLARGKPFEVFIQCSQNSYKVTVNSKHFCDYQHRLPFQCVSHIYLEGNVIVQFLGFDKAEETPVPCVHPIPGGMYPGRMVRVQGSTPIDADRFEINLQCGSRPDQMEDIAFHFNPRFHQQCVVRNHLTSAGWAHEETSGGMPLEAGKPFDALILCEYNCLKIALNGVHFCEFSHRLPFHNITHLTVEGDVIVHSVVFDGQDRLSYGLQGAPPPTYGAPSYPVISPYTHRY